MLVASMNLSKYLIKKEQKKTAQYGLADSNYSLNYFNKSRRCCLDYRIIISKPIANANWI